MPAQVKLSKRIKNILSMVGCMDKGVHAALSEALTHVLAWEAIERLQISNYGPIEIYSQGVTVCGQWTGMNEATFRGKSLIDALRIAVAALQAAEAGAQKGG